MNAHCQIRAPFKPATLDDAARTVELIASTGAGVTRHDMDGAFLEVLDVQSGAVDLTRADGMPLLDSHRQDGLDRVLGVVRGLRFENGNLIVKVEFSTRAEAVWQDVKAGIIRNVSVGYAPTDWRDGTNPRTGARVRTITAWELHEVSLVPVGADPRAKVRSKGQMTDTPMATAPAPENRAIPQSPPAMRGAVNQEIRALASTFDLGADWANDLIDRNANEGEARSAAIETLRTRTA